MLTWLLGRFGNVPDANGNMLTAIRAPAFRLGHFHDFACNALQPLIDALFVRRLHERLTMTANKRKHLSQWALETVPRVCTSDGTIYQCMSLMVLFDVLFFGSGPGGRFGIV